MMSDRSESQRLNNNILKTVVGIVMFIALVLGLFLNKFFSPRIMSQQELATNGAIVFETPRLVKDFSLVDQHGQAFGLKQLEGKWSLMFFGFTHCPDICPTTLMQLNRVYNKLNDSVREQTQIVLVSVDPARDSSAALKRYVGHFNQDFMGLTGEFITIKRLADNLNVAFNKVVQGDDYTVDHTGNIVLINPKGHYHGFYRPPFELARLKGVHQSIVSQF